MAVSLRSVSQAPSSGTATTVINKPAGTAGGDVLVAVMFSDSDSASQMIAPGDWTIGGSGTPVSNHNVKVWCKTATVAEPATYSFGLAASDTSVLYVYAFTGADPVLPIGLLSFGGSGTASTAHDAPSVTTAVDGSILVCGWGAAAASGTRSYTPPAGMTEDGDLATDWQFGAVAHQSLGPAGATGTKTATCGVSAAPTSVTLTVSPAASGGGGSVLSETTSWIDSDGGMTPLEVEWKTSGRFAPPAAFAEEGVPTQPGLVLREVRHGAREFVLPIWITADTEADLRTAMRDLVARMDPVRGDGKIRITSPLGDQREVTCRVVSGLEMNESLGDMSGPTVQRAAVVFRAHDPYWAAPSDTVDTFTGTAPPSFFPFFPLRLSSSEVFTNCSVDNTGDVESWPVWTVFGPAASITVANMTTGKSFSLSTTLFAGESAVIDTRPLFKTVTKNDGTNLFPNLSNDSSLWSLVPGVNAVRIEMTATTTPGSSVQLAWRPRYLSA